MGAEEFAVAGRERALEKGRCGDVGLTARRPRTGAEAWANGLVWDVDRADLAAGREKGAGFA